METQNAQVIFGSEDAHFGILELHQFRAAIQFSKGSFVECIDFIMLQINPVLLIFRRVQYGFSGRRLLRGDTQIDISRWTQSSFGICSSSRPPFD
jgi:hypothetical protein